MPDENTNQNDDSGAGANGATDQNGTGAAGGQGQDDLGDAGKRALDAERASRRAAQKKADELEKELQRLRESTMSDQEKAVEQARREARAEANKAAATRLVQAEVRAAATGKLADPEDAIRFLTLDEFAVDDDGGVDKKAITKALDELVKAKPYLAAGATRPTGNADQGARGSSSAGSSMNDLIRQAVRR